ncbi:MAG: FtsB family cell division protein [Chthoniobacterales bacterium]
MRDDVADRKRRRRAPVVAMGALNRLILFLIVGAGCMLAFFLFRPQLQKLEHMESRYEELVREKKSAELRKLRLDREIKLLKTDPEYIENIARDKLDLMKEGETIYRLDNKHKETDASVGAETEPPTG